MNVEPQVKTFERRLKSALSSGGYKLMSSNGTGLNNYWTNRNGFKDVLIDDVMIYGMERLEIEPSVGYIVDNNLIAVNGTIYMIHPIINTTISATVNQTANGEEQKVKFKVSSFPDRKFKVYFSVLISTRWDKMVIRYLSYDETDPRSYGYRYYQSNYPIFDPVLECNIDVEDFEVCTKLEKLVKDTFNQVPDKILSLIRVIASGIKP